MIKIAWVRGAHLNNFEGQNYDFQTDKDCQLRITGFGCKKSVHQKLPFEVVRLPSLADYNMFGRWGRALANRTLGDIQNLFGLEQFAGQFDIFHTADPHYYYSYQLARLRHENRIKKLLVTSWETIPFNNESIPVKKQNKYYVLQHADHFLCYTQRAKECLMLEGIDKRKITVINIGVNPDKFKISFGKAQDKPFGKAQGKPFGKAQGKQNSKFKSNSKLNKTVNILFVGRLTQEKGVTDAYEAYKNVKLQNSKFNSNLNIKFQIVGEGPLKQQLLKKINHDHLQHHVSIESRTYEEMPGVYKNADIFLLPSRRTATWEEQYGMVLVEAMTAGLPVIAYDTGAIREVIANCGILIRDGHTDSLTKSLYALIEDKKEREKLGTMGKERSGHFFDSRQSAKKIAQLYNSL